MALLSDLLRRGGLTKTADGQLVRDATLQGVSGSAGTASTPSTPAAADSMGASPDAAKMAGTPAAQVGAQSFEALRRGAPTAPAAAPRAPAQSANQPQSPVDSLAQAERTGAAQSKGQSEAESARTQHQARLTQAFGDVGLRVNSLVESAVSRAAASGSNAGFTYAPDTIKKLGLTGSQATQDTAEAALQALAANPTDQAKLSIAQIALRDAGFSGAADTATVLGLLGKQTGGQAAAGRVADVLTLTSDVRSKAGISDADLETLGISPADADKMTPDQFRERLELEASRNTGVADDAATAQSGLLDAASARALGRDVRDDQRGAAYTAETQAGDVLEAAQAGEEIEIGGVQYKLSDLLADDKMTELADRYLAAPPGDALRTQIESQMPEFAAFLEANQDAVAATASKATATAGKLKETQDRNAQQMALVSNSMGPRINSLEVMRDMGFDVEKFTVGRVDLSKVGIIHAITNHVDGQATGPAIAARMVELKKQDPASYEELKKLGPEELRQTGILAADGTEAVRNWSEFQQVIRDRAEIPNMSPADLSRKLFGVDSLTKAHQNAWAQASLGGDSTAWDKLHAVFDADADGQRDSDDQIAATIKKGVTDGATLDVFRKMAGGGGVQGAQTRVGTDVGKIGGIAAYLAPTATAGGNLDPGEIAKLPVDSTKMRPSLLRAVLGGKRSTPASDEALRGHVEKLELDHTGKQIDSQFSQFQNNEYRPLWAYASMVTKGNDAAPPKLNGLANQEAANQLIRHMETMAANDPDANKSALKKAIQGLSNAIVTGKQEDGGAGNSTVGTGVGAGQVAIDTNPSSVHINIDPNAATGHETDQTPEVIRQQYETTGKAVDDQLAKFNTSAEYKPIWAYASMVAKGNKGQTPPPVTTQGQKIASLQSIDTLMNMLNDPNINREAVQTVINGFKDALDKYDNPEKYRPKVAPSDPANRLYEQLQPHLQTPVDKGKATLKKMMGRR